MNNHSSEMALFSLLSNVAYIHYSAIHKSQPTLQALFVCLRSLWHGRPWNSTSTPADCFGPTCMIAPKCVSPCRIGCSSVFCPSWARSHSCYTQQLLRLLSPHHSATGHTLILADNVEARVHGTSSAQLGLHIASQTEAFSGYIQIEFNQAL